MKTLSSGVVRHQVVERPRLWDPAERYHKTFVGLYASNPLPSLNRSMHMLSGSPDQHSKRAESRLIIYNVEGSEIITTASGCRFVFSTNARPNQEKWLWLYQSSSASFLVFDFGR